MVLRSLYHLLYLLHWSSNFPQMVLKIHQNKSEVQGGILVVKVVDKNQSNPKKLNKGPDIFLHF